MKCNDSDTSKNKTKDRTMHWKYVYFYFFLKKLLHKGLFGWEISALIRIEQYDKSQIDVKKKIIFI